MLGLFPGFGPWKSLPGSLVQKGSKRFPGSRVIYIKGFRVATALAKDSKIGFPSRVVKPYAINVDKVKRY